MKELVDEINAVPSKKVFLSIINDYDLNLSICELIDNALDNWTANGRRKKLSILISLDKDQQTIRVRDDSGGVNQEDLHVIVGPGHTGNEPTDEIIGIFGVGTKRAVVALAQDIRIITRYNGEPTYRVEFDETWLQSEDWMLPVYKVDPIEEGTTIVDLSKLRIPITEEGLSHLIDHLQATYAKFLMDGDLTIKVNNTLLKPITFEKWAYPPGYEPRHYTGQLPTEDGKPVKVDVIAGLSNESSPTGDYGVYLYCNNRLIERGLKSYDVGFTKGLAGKAHPSVSLTCVIISLTGEARSMPWNSSKSALYPNHRVYAALRTWLVQVVKDLASLSRRFEGNWEENVFQYKTGRIVKHENFPFQMAKKSYLPELPKARMRYVDRVRQANKQIWSVKRWTIGLYESIVAVELIRRQRLEQKNRIAIVLLDSTLEIAFKEYLVNESGHSYHSTDLVKIFQNRTTVQNEVKKYATTIKASTWAKIDYYYKLRCTLIHERAAAGITDSDVEDCLKVVQLVLWKLFKLTFDDS
jgi:hypothetical protein